MKKEKLMQKEILIIQTTRENANRGKGFTLIEALVVVAIIGLLGMALTPGILNSLETRRLESEARSILTTVEKAKFQAVKTKLNHRVRFYEQEGNWFYIVEREETPGSWSAAPGEIPKQILPEFVVTVNLPTQLVEFSALGFVSNYDPQQNSVILQSIKLLNKRQPDLREIWFYRGGSIRYEKAASGG